MTISSEFTINGELPTDAVAVDGGSTVFLELTSTTGANGIEWSVVGNDHPTRVNPTITTSGSPQGATASFVMPVDTGDGLGQSYRIQCKVSDGKRAPSTSTTVRIVGIANTTDVVPFASGEEFDRDADYGWTMTVNRALANGGLMAGLGPYADETEREAVTLAESDWGKFAIQLDDATLWVVMPEPGGTGAEWQSASGGGSPVFTGDFAALAATYGLTVDHYVRGDLGVTGTVGSGSAAWANQSGTGGNIVPTSTGGTNGIGTIGSGLNGKASIIQNGASQGAKYTMPARADVATTNRHRYWVFRLLAIPSPSSFLHLGSDSGNSVQTIATTSNWSWGGNGTTAAVTASASQWYRGRLSLDGTFGPSGTCRIKVGATEQVYGSLASGTASSGTSYFGCFNDLGQLPLNVEWLLSMELVGTEADFLAFAADADAKIQTFWTSAIAI